MKEQVRTVVAYFCGVAAMLFITIGCEKSSVGSDGDGAPSSVGGTWAGGGISVTLVEESRQSDGVGGEKSEGSATLTNSHGTFGLGLYGYQGGSIYAQGDGFGVSGEVRGDTWNARYIFPDDGADTYVTLKRQ